MSQQYQNHPTMAVIKSHMFHVSDSKKNIRLSGMYQFRRKDLRELQFF